MTSTICKQDLMAIGYKEHTARSLICQAKAIMVQNGYPFYNNRRLGLVPTEVVESIIGTKLQCESRVINDDK
ncbi:DUF3173 domain-containing protein [Leuconostoc citreum]|nr:DUF3173 domain-containing protein [Leuconostoc citreum]MBE4725105.1 DUF3173 domain-containing protein [Leuconostoc citreum]MCT3069478.1 DUF3173 domain-containing protein [Leuconostoc citreum]QEA37467.1 DUF3173 domain-containing protein [Leuconostoc citreum]